MGNDSLSISNTRKKCGLIVNFNFGKQHLVNDVKYHLECVTGTFC